MEEIYYLATADILDKAKLLKKQRRYREALELLSKNSYKFRINEQAGIYTIDNNRSELNVVKRWGVG